MKAQKLSFNSNSNVGLFAYADDNICLVGNLVSEEKQEVISETLDVNVEQISLAGTPLIGVFMAGNSKGVIIPSICYKHELEKLDELKVNYKVISSKHTALGNNLLIGEEVGFYAHDLEDEAKAEIEEHLGIKLHKVKLGEIDTIGSIAVVHENKAVIGEMVGKKIENLNLQSEINFVKATINQGSDYIRSGMFKNSHGFIIGGDTAGIEVINIEQELFR